MKCISRTFAVFFAVPLLAIFTFALPVFILQIATILASVLITFPISFFT